MNLEEKILQVMGGMHVGAVATIAGNKPAVRFMALRGYDDMSLVAGTMKSTRKVGELKAHPDAAISIWSGVEFSDPYVGISATAEVHEDRETKERYWNPVFEEYFGSIDNPDFILLVFVAKTIEYYTPPVMEPEIWNR
ncbi:pyridoxamine 5'-phosphate oxidase family protein [Methanogenium organophilum]|uniref:Pyridoxamine 5'-phosphate oxidase family protein n=1 Tax=Methanogenium organophilum TaxID=2199 RepID=A0A9X9S239_METOG|nr:pyridoxamine 5'-phosphate oxidase family protein [Methanogenium organophilum]WAI00424.1 pyridoxamine 5'-phosphate oxidase family protein [Methanogenium organophilum]